MSTNALNRINNDAQFDVLIAGGGLVGCALACALGQSPLQVALLDAQPLDHVPAHADQRKFALARASMNALTALGVIAALPQPPTPILRVHVSRSGDFGRVLIHASDHRLDHLGAVVLASDLIQALQRSVSALKNVTVLPPARLSAITTESSRVSITTDQAQQVTSRLLVGADGTASITRQLLGIETDSHDYAQSMFVSAITSDKRPDGTAWERFTEHGPIALLPMAGGRFGAMCAVARDEVDRIQALDDAAYLDYFQQRFGWRAGRLSHTGPRSVYPLTQRIAQRLTAPRAALIGNAAQTIHPIGAQGFNLGLRDALTLAESIAADVNDPGQPSLLSAYSAARTQDRQRTLDFSDGLARITSNPGLPAKLLRSVGLSALTLDDGLRAPLVAGAMGFRGQVPQAARSAP